MTGRRVLVVDDDPDMVETLCDVLELYGWETIKAYDGTEAVVLTQQRQVDVVLMDVRMPRMDGVTALVAIKARNPSVPIVLVTAIAPEDRLEEASRKGAFRILRKPVDLPHLLEVLKLAT